MKFTIVTDGEALKFLYYPTQSLAKFSTAVVHCCSTELSSGDYSSIHRSVKNIQHADFLSRNSQSFVPSQTSDCLLLKSLPKQLKDLVPNTRKFFERVISEMRRWWANNERRRSPVFLAQQENISATSDCLLCLNDRAVVPPTLRLAILQDLHSGRLTVGTDDVLVTGTECRHC